MRSEMICRFISEDCPADCAHRERHREIIHDDFGEHSPCVLASECIQFGFPTYCIPVFQPNRVVIEVYDDGAWGHVRAERPDEVVVVRHFLAGDPDLVYDNGSLPIEPLSVQRTAVGVAGKPVEVRFEVAGEPLAVALEEEP